METERFELGEPRRSDGMRGSGALGKAAEGIGRGKARWQLGARAPGSLLWKPAPNPSTVREVLPWNGGAGDGDEAAIVGRARGLCGVGCAGCPLPGSVQGQVGWSSEHPGLVKDVPARGRGLGTR